jgi:hypothetical protein
MEKSTLNAQVADKRLKASSTLEKMAGQKEPLKRKRPSPHGWGLLHNREFNPYHEVASAIMSEVTCKFKQD